MPDTMTSSPCCIIHNPTAGSGEQIELLRQYAHKQGNPPIELCDTEHAGHGREMAVQQCSTGERIIAAAGGDGTISEIVGGLVEADCNGTPTLLILPMGTGNDLSRTLGITDLQSGLDLLAGGGEVRPLDVMRWTSELSDGSEESGYSANVMAAGFSSKIQEAMDGDMKKRWGPLAYYRAAIGAAASLEPHRLMLCIDDEDCEPINVLNAVVANGQYAGGGVHVAPSADVSDGLLDLVAVLDGSALDIAALSARFLIGTILDSDQIVHVTGKKFVLEADPPLPFNADGDPVGTGRLTVEVMPGALNVLVPASA